MKIYIQSKSGDHNATHYHSDSETEFFKTLRRLGYYLDDKNRVVPFEEIQYLREEKD